MSIYNTILDLFNTYIYGGNMVAGSYEELVAIFFSTTACLFVVSLPFIVVYFIIRFFCSFGRC